MVGRKVSGECLGHALTMAKLYNIVHHANCCKMFFDQNPKHSPDCNGEKRFMKKIFLVAKRKHIC